MHISICIVYLSRSAGWSVKGHQEKHPAIAAEVQRLESITAPDPGLIQACPCCPPVGLANALVMPITAESQRDRKEIARKSQEDVPWPGWRSNWGLWGSHAGGVPGSRQIQS